MKWDETGESKGVSFLWAAIILKPWSVFKEHIITPYVKKPSRPFCKFNVLPSPSSFSHSLSLSLSILDPPSSLSSSTSLWFPPSPLWMQRSIMPTLQGDEKREEGVQIENGKRQTETVYMTRTVRSEMTDRVKPTSSPLPGREIPSRLHCCGTQLHHQIKCWGRHVTLW